MSIGIGNEQAKAWAEGYRMGVADERTSEANIGIAGFNAKVEPDRQNPYGTPQPKQEQDELVYDLLDDAREVLEVIVHDQPDDTFSDARDLIPKLREQLGLPTIINFTKPQTKEWVGLTSEDIYACDEQSKLPKYEITNADLQAFAYAIEAKLKEKNGY